MVQEWSNCISASDVDALLRAHDGDCALLCLWCARTGSRDLERAARDLCMTRSQVAAAAEKLGRMLPAFLRSSSADSAALPTEPAHDTPSQVKKDTILPPADELPEYTSEEIAACSEKDASFRAVLDLAEALLGKELARHDVSRLLGI